MIQCLSPKLGTLTDVVPNSTGDGAAHQEAPACWSARFHRANRRLATGRNLGSLRLTERSGACSFRGPGEPLRTTGQREPAPPVPLRALTRPAAALTPTSHPRRDRVIYARRESPVDR